MKKLCLVFTLLLALCGRSNLAAQALPSGVFALGDAATTIETGKWYFLYNAGTTKFAQENASNALNQADSPVGVDASDGVGYLVALEQAPDNGSYYIKTGRGNYFKSLTTAANGTGATPSNTWSVTINPISGTTGHFTIYGKTKRYLTAPADGGDLRGGTESTAGSIGDWVFYNVTTQSLDDLTGIDLYNYQMSRMGLIRLRNKRSSTSYLTSDNIGSASGAQLRPSGMTQVWMLEKKDDGYTLFNADNGQYLQSNFSKPSNSKQVLYIQFSPNNRGNEAYINISSDKNFSGQSCLNMARNGTELAKWSYSGDDGSDWAIELVEDITENDVREHLNAANGYVAELRNGAYYRLYSMKYGVYATESESEVKSVNLNAENFAQYWKAVKNGNGYCLQNVLTQAYIQPQNSMSQIYRTATNAATLYPKRADDKWTYTWSIANTQNGAYGMHTDAAKNVVRWYTDADASIWAFQEVELTEEDIENARNERLEYQNIVDNIPIYQAHLNNLFEDYACTVLKSDIQALTDEQLAQNADYQALTKGMQDMVLKVKNNTWQQYTNTNTGYTADYEKFFRIADYQIYSNCDEMGNSANFTMSNAFGRLSGPTGIVANPGDIVYIYVDAAPKSDCSLMVELVSTDGVAGNHPSGAQKELKRGLNVISSNQQMMIYIFHQLNNTNKYLADYPDIKIHIDGGMLNGYWDATRGMTNADWALLRQQLLKAPFLNLKTKHLVFQMSSDLVKAAEPTEMEGLMRIWDMIVENEDRYMGVEDFEGRYNNIWNAFSGASSYMHAGGRGTWYTESTIGTIMNYENMRKPGNIWGPSHEIGHNHQGSINVVGTTESSNNLFSNINVFEQGIQTTRRQLPCDNFAAFVNNIPWSGRNIWNSTSMFFQLYLYFHAMHHDDQFYPNLFRRMRQFPITKVSGWDSTTQFQDGNETKTGANVSYGRLDYLHLAKMICDVAQADLSEFFEAYGMFMPVDKYFVGDYANYLVTTTQKDIDEAKAYMQKYPKKLGNIMFIDDHIGPMKDANPNNIFDGKPSGTKKTNNTGQHDELNNGLPVGDVGDYESFDGRTSYSTDNDYYIISGTSITFRGTGYIGHKFYDLNGNLIWATNAKKVTLPAKLQQLGPDNYIVVAAEPNLKDVPCVNNTGKKKAQMYFGNEDESKVWYMNANTPLGNYMPENAIGVMQTADAEENIIGTPNIIDVDNTAKSIVLNGDQPAYIPVEAVAENVTFTKSIDGYAALNLPFDVTSANIAGLKTATYDNNILNVTDAGRVAAGKPVVVNGSVNIALSQATVKAGSYQVLNGVKVLAADGQSVTEVETASPFTYNMEEATGIQNIEEQLSSAGKNGNNVYDLTGRRVNNPTKAGVYIINGKKAIVK